MKIRFLLGIIFVFFYCFCFANFPSKIVLLREQDKVEVDGRSCYTISDTARQLTIEKIPFAYFEANDNFLSYNAEKSATYWKLLFIKNNTQKKHWILELPDPHITEVQFFRKDNGHWITQKTTGFAFPFNQRTVLHKNFIFDLPIEPNKTDTIALKLFSERYSGMMPNIRTFEDYSAYFLTEYHVLGMFYGIIFLMAIYNLIVGFYLKESVYLFYCFYLISAAFYAYAEDGLGFQWWWGNYPLMNEWIEKLSPGALLLSFLFYTDSFLELNKQSLNSRWLILGSGLFYFILQISIPLVQSLELLSFITPFFITYVIAFRQFLQGKKHVRFFIGGGTVILLSFIIFYLRVTSVLLPNVYTVYVFNYGIIVEIIFFSMSLSDKFRLTKLEKEKVQQGLIDQLKFNEEIMHRVNSELEMKVQARTKELQEKASELQKSNEELQLLKVKLYEMNSQMDKHIWDLEKRVKETLENGIFSKKVTQHEFLELFTEVRCNQYLIELKWKNGFECEKCGNKKFGRGNTNFTLKCTKCQHQASSTAKTLFHQLRFPLPKAFYLTYLFLNNDTTTYEELSRSLEINKNTIWKFYQKINQKLSTLPLSATKENVWKGVILN